MPHASTRRRRAARARRALGRSLAVAPLVAIVALDFALRGRLLLALTRDAWLWYEGCAAVGAVAWGAFVVAAARRRGATRWVARVAVALLALFAVGTQLQTWARYHSFLNWRPALMGNSLLPCLAQELWTDRLRALALLLAPVIVALAIVVAMRRIAPPRRRPSLLALPLGVVALGAAVLYAKPDAGWDTGTTPDVLWLSAVGALGKSMRSHEDVMVTLPWLPDARTAPSLPALHASPSVPRNVLFLLDESVRADRVCSAPGDGDCPSSPFTDHTLPLRYGFTQMRALDSTTALSMATILTGRGPASPRATLLSAPLLFEYAHAAGIDTAFWTSQNLLYANAGRFLDGAPMSHFVTGTSLEPYADYLDGADDAKLLERVETDLPSLHEPYFAMVQLANTHFPYVVDEHDLPFSWSRDWRKMDAFGRTAVRDADAVHRQDKLLAQFLDRLPRDRTVVVFVSDHGEQIGEHGRTGHTWTEYDVELHVPMWIDAPDGTLTTSEARELRLLRDQPITMLELAPTVLDLLGLWADPSFASWRSTMKGVSLLRRPPPPDRAVVMTNCSPLFWCSSPNWGAMRGTRKLFAGEGDRGWHCFDVGSDPDEAHDLGPSACGDLESLAEADGRGVPF